MFLGCSIFQDFPRVLIATHPTKTTYLHRMLHIIYILTFGLFLIIYYQRLLFKISHPQFEVRTRLDLKKLSKSFIKFCKQEHTLREHFSIKLNFNWLTMSSFVKLKKENTVEINGVKSSIRNGRITSTGSDSLDFVIGGGIEVSSLVLIGKIGQICLLLVT